MYYALTEQTAPNGEKHHDTNGKDRRKHSRELESTNQIDLKTRIITLELAMRMCL